MTVIEPQKSQTTAEDEKSRALAAYRRKLTEHREIDQRLKDLRSKVYSLVIVMIM